MRTWLGLIILISTVFTASQTVAQEPAKPDAATRKFVGIGDCRNCHRNGSLPKETDADLDPFERAALGSISGTFDNSWVKLDEYKTWLESDKHAQAFTSLLNDRSKQMGALLGVDVSRDKRCLACHVGSPLSSWGGDKDLIPPELVKDPRVFTGVSCEGCHGPAGNSGAADGTQTKGWLSPHISKDSWRFLSEVDKREKFGFASIRSVSARTRICLSCHLGNANEGRIVTHEMYVAGHPPLPDFEMETFSQQLPKHWRDFSNKEQTVREEFLKRNADDIYGRDTYKLDNLHETNGVLISGLVAFSEYLKLTSALADEQKSMPVVKPRWPELALFECSACHKELKDRSWRKRRLLREVGFKPPLRVWPSVLAKLALKRLPGGSEELDRRMTHINGLVIESSRELWIKEVPPLTEWIDQQARALERKPLPQEEGLQVLRDILVVGDSELWDYDSARQLVWFTHVLRRELSTDRTPERMRNTVAALDAELAEVEQLFVLNLNDGIEVEQRLPGGVKGRRVTETDLTKTQALNSKYDAADFRNKFEAVAAKLSKAVPKPSQP